MQLRESLDNYGLKEGESLKKREGEVLGVDRVFAEIYFYSKK